MNKSEYIEKYGIEKYQRMLEYHKQYNKQYRKRTYKGYFKNYYDNNKEHLAEYHKIYYDNNKEYYKQYYNTPTGKASLILNNCKRTDNILFGENKCDLTHDWIINNILNATHCHYCGCELNYDNLSIDRKNSELPHTKDNCVACCKTCNNCKQDTPYEEYIAKLRETSNN